MNIYTDFNISSISVVVKKKETADFVFNCESRAYDGFLFVTNGKGVFEKENIKENLQEGSLILLEKGEKYIVRASEEDFEYIRDKDISADECARYADGWYSCLPFVELYELFQKEELKEKFLHLLHLSMFARVVDKQYIGNWNHLIGNIPRFIKLCDVEVKWSTIFQIFLRFLDFSQIYYPPSIGTTEISNLKE